MKDTVATGKDETAPQTAAIAPYLDGPTTRYFMTCPVCGSAEEVSADTMRCPGCGVSALIHSESQR